MEHVVKDITIYHDDVYLNTIATAIMDLMYSAVYRRLRKDLAERVMLIYSRVLFHKSVRILFQDEVRFIFSL